MQLALNAGNVKSAMRDAGAVSADLWKVPLSDLHVIENFNVRVNGAEHREHVSGLVDSIMANGFYANKPLAGYVATRDGKQIICITDGHCRFEAAQEAVKRGAEIKALPVVVSPKGTSMEDLTVGLVTNNSGRPLGQYGIGLVCKRLIGFGWDEAQIAGRLSMTKQRVGDLLTLVAAPADIRKLVSSGAVSASQAIATIKKDGDKAGAKLTAGVEKAAQSGKKKATKKHIDAKPTYRDVVKALLAWNKKVGIVDDDGFSKIIKMAQEASA